MGENISSANKVILSFKTLIKSYKKLQSNLIVQMKALASNTSGAAPGQFLFLQFQMSQVTQVGETISNLIAQVNSVINSTVRNQRTQ
jgi:hypothetical protein